MFYALYYGVMARDFAEICAEKMASNVGYYRPSGIPDKQLQVGGAGGGRRKKQLNPLFECFSFPTNIASMNLVMAALRVFFFTIVTPALAY